MEKAKNWLPAIIVAAIIFFASAQTGETVDNTGFTKNSYHIGAHFVLYILLCITLFKGTKNVYWAMGLAFLYAIFDEVHQTFVPGRSFQYSDILVDSIGIALAGLILCKPPGILKNWLNK